METFINIVKHLGERRVWVFITGVLTFVLSALKVQYNFDIPVLTDLLTAFGSALSVLIMSGLALWSYLKPKTKDDGTSK